MVSVSNVIVSDRPAVVPQSLKKETIQKSNVGTQRETETSLSFLSS